MNAYLNPKTQGLKPSDVHYLAFEGGGGKGAAYIGALAAFAEKEIGILKKVKGAMDYELNRNKIHGISGSSAGAITATLIASGHTLNEIFEFTNSDKPNSFYDFPDPRRIPYACPDSRISDGSCDVVAMPQEIPLPILFEQSQDSPTIKSGLTKSIMHLIPFPPLVSIAEVLDGVNDLKQTFNRLLKNEKFQTWVLQKLIEKLPVGALPEVMLNQLKRYPLAYIKSLIFDAGLFSGYNARSRLDSMIGLKMGKIYEATFKEFVGHFKTELRLTGTNLETGKSLYFSVEKTPDFKVVDALRISMGFPFAFKPVIIERGAFKTTRLEPYESEDILAGKWVDGGILNNIPIHAFDHKKMTRDGGLLNSMLGVRLDEEPGRAVIQDFIDFAKAFVNTILSYSTEGSQFYTTQDRSQAIELPTTGLSTLDFRPEALVLKGSLLESSKRVMQYFFGEGAKEGDVVYQYTSRIPEKGMSRSAPRRHVSHKK